MPLFAAKQTEVDSEIITPRNQFLNKNHLKFRIDFYGIVTPRIEIKSNREILNDSHPLLLVHI